MPVAQRLPTPVPEPVLPPPPAPVPPPPAVGSAVDSPGRTLTPSHRCQGNSLPSFVASRFNCRRCRLKFIAWQPRLPGFLPVPRCRSHPWCALPRIIPRCTSFSSQSPSSCHRSTKWCSTYEQLWSPPDSDSSDSSLAQLTSHLFGRPHVPAPRLHLTSSAVCRSRRCLHHCSDRRFAQPAETRTSSSWLPPNTTARRLRRCRVGFFSNHCRSSRCRATRQPASTQLTCRRPHCSEFVQPGCPVGCCNLHCTSPRCPLHDPLSLSGNGMGAARC